MANLALRDERGFNQVYLPVGSAGLRARRRHDWLVAQARIAGARRVLELGCGIGDAAAHLAANLDAEVVGVDLSDAFLDRARAVHQHANLRFVRCDLLTADVETLGRYDLVCGNGILHHLVQRLDAVLRALRNRCNPGGRLAFIEPNLLNPYCAFIFGTAIGRRLARLEPGEMAFTPGRLRSALTVAGWHEPTVAMRDFLIPGLPRPLVAPVLALEPALEATALTRWLAQSHFITARA